MFSALDFLLVLAGLAVPAAITLACWLLVAPDARRAEATRAVHAVHEPAERAVVMVAADKVDTWTAEVDGTAEGVEFADLARVGANPARIIPAWRDFGAQRAAAGGTLRGIGEPIWAGRSSSELVECQRHE